MPRKRLAKKMMVGHPDESAIIIESHPLNERVQYLLELEDGVILALFDSLSYDTAIEFFKRLPEERLHSLFDELSFEQQVGLIARTGKSLEQEILEKAEENAAYKLRSILEFREQELVNLVETKVFSVKIDTSLPLIKSLSQETKNKLIDPIFVTDEKGIFLGLVSIKEIWRAEKGTLLSDLVKTGAPVFRLNQNIETVISSSYWKRHETIAVVTPSNVFLGIIDRKKMVEFQYSKGKNNQSEERFMETVLSLTEAFWGAGALFIADKISSSPEEKK